MNEFLAEQVAIEREYHENRLLMERSRRELASSRAFCLFGNIGVFLICIASTFLWSVNTRVEIMIELGATELTEKAFPMLSLLLFYVPGMIALALATDIKQKSIFPRISAYLSIALLVIVVINWILQFQYTTQNLPCIIYLVAEILFSYTSLNAFGRMEQLSTRDGYPDFHYAVMTERTSQQDKYLREREEWESKKRSESPSTSEDALKAPGVIKAEKPTEMDGVYAESTEQNEWFFVSQTTDAAEEKPVIEPDSVSVDPSYLPDDDFYKIYEKEDIRKKPL